MHLEQKGYVDRDRYDKAKDGVCMLKHYAIEFIDDIVRLLDQKSCRVALEERKRLFRDVAKDDPADLDLHRRKVVPLYPRTEYVGEKHQKAQSDYKEQHGHKLGEKGLAWRGVGNPVDKPFYRKRRQQVAKHALERRKENKTGDNRPEFFRKTEIKTAKGFCQRIFPHAGIIS